MGNGGGQARSQHCPSSPPPVLTAINRRPTFQVTFASELSTHSLNYRLNTESSDSMSSIGESSKSSKETTDPLLAFNHPGLCPTCREMRINRHRPNQWGRISQFDYLGPGMVQGRTIVPKVVQANGVIEWRTYRKRIAALREAHGRGCSLCGYPLKVIDGFLHHGSPCPDELVSRIALHCPTSPPG